MMSDVMTVTLCARIECSVENHQLYAIKRSCWLKRLQKKISLQNIIHRRRKNDKTLRTKYTAEIQKIQADI